MNPDAVDRIVAYRLGIRQVRNLLSVLILFLFSCILLLRLCCCDFYSYFKCIAEFILFYHNIAL